MNILLKDKSLLLFSIILFAGGMILGITLILSVNTETAVLGMNSENYYDKREGFEGSLFFFIQNLKVVLLLVSGILLFGIPTVPILFLNGLWLGGVLAGNYLSGMGVTELFLTVVPHGLFEIPALILAGYLGLYGLKFYTEKKSWKRLSYIVGSIVLLLFLASFIEGFITPKSI
jgi:stage II sporulation protein M